jgi:hypothetical protein
MKRRTLIAVCGSIVVAGCSEREGTGDDAEPPQTEKDRTSSTQNTTAESTQTPSKETPQPAQFELVEYGFPERVEIGESFKPSITVRNIGETSGEYESSLLMAAIGGDEWERLGDWAWETIAPSEESTIEANESWSFDYLYELKFRLEGFDETTRLDSVTRQLSIGEQYTTPWDTRFTVDNIGLRDEYRYEFNGETRFEQAPEGKQWAFAEIQAENMAGEIAQLPTKFDMLLIADNQQYEFKIILDKDGEYEGGDVQPNVVEKGWLAFEIPEDVTDDSVAFIYNPTTSEGKIAVRWEK